MKNLEKVGYLSISKSTPFHEITELFSFVEKGHNAKIYLSDVEDHDDKRVLFAVYSYEKASGDWLCPDGTFRSMLLNREEWKDHVQYYKENDPEYYEMHLKDEDS